MLHSSTIDHFAAFVGMMLLVLNGMSAGELTAKGHLLRSLVPFGPSKVIPEAILDHC